MANNELHQLLDQDIHAINDELNDINCGGCGLAALTLHSALLIHGIKSEIVLVDHRYSKADVADLLVDTGTADINSAYISIFEDTNMDSYIDEDSLNSHMCVLVDGKLYDTDGLYDGKAISEHIRPEVMEMFLVPKTCWNQTFNRQNKRNDDVRGTFERFFDSLLADIVPEVSHE